MDYQQYQEDPDFSGNWDQKPVRPRRSGLETAALILSIFSLFFISYFPLTLVPIGLSVLFALLSKGGSMKISQFARYSIIISAVSFVFGTYSTVSFFYRNWDIIVENMEEMVDRAYQILEDPESYYEEYELDPYSSSDPFDSFYGYEDYDDLIDDIYGGTPYYYQMPSPMSPDSLPQQPHDTV